MGKQTAPEYRRNEIGGGPFSLPEKIVDFHNHVRTDKETDELIDLMNAYQVERTLIMGVYPLPACPDSNALVLAAAKKHPDRFVGGVYADPREGAKAIETVHRFHGEGFRIVKLFPNLGYYPDDPVFRPFFDAVAKLGMAVLSHCGFLNPAAGPDSAEYHSRPSRFEKLIRRYPDTPFIMAHMGGIAGFLEAAMLTTRTRNAYADTAPGQGLWVFKTVPQIAATFPPEQIIWGADSYDYAGLIPQYKSALEDAGFGPHFHKVWRDNAIGLLKRIGAITA